MRFSSESSSLKDYEEEKTRSKIDQSSCFESKNFVCWVVNNSIAFQIKLINKSEKSFTFIISIIIWYELNYIYCSDKNDVI
jgi:hypothetical protein